jgi:hypothetical protein
MHIVWHMNLNSVVRYFDINSELKAQIRAQAKSGGEEAKPKLPWLWQWIALFLGIWIQPYFELYRNTQHWEWTGGFGRVLFAAITAVMIFPGLYRKLIDEPKPLIILLAPCFIGGMGYQSLLATALKAGAKLVSP